MEPYNIIILDDDNVPCVIPADDEGELADLIQDYGSRPGWRYVRTAQGDDDTFRAIDEAYAILATKP